MVKITAILGNYNDSRFLINCVSKLSAQKPDELLIVDDNSTDKSVELIKSLQKKYPLRLIKNDGIKGPFGAFIKGCQEAKNEYVSWWACDDEPLPGYFVFMKQAIKDFPLVDVYTCNSKVIREGMTFNRVLFPFTAYISPDYAAKIYKRFSGRVNICGMILKREILWECFGEKKTNFDELLFLSNIFNKGFVNVGEILYLYRSYPNGFGAKGKIKDIQKAKEEHGKIYAENPELYKRIVESKVLENYWFSWLALRLIMYLPKWLRIKIYKNYYEYSYKIEKL